MNPTKLILAVLLSTFFSAALYAKHPHPSSHQQPLVRPSPELSHQHAIKHYYSGHKSSYRQYQFRAENVYRHPLHVNYLSYPGYKHYRSGKLRSCHAHQHQHLDDDARRDTYRLVAGALILSEVLHHARH